MKNKVLHSRHSAARSRQRSISDLALRLLLDYGDEEYQAGGDVYRYFSKRAFQCVSRDLDEVRKNLPKLAKVVAVETKDGSLKTVMLRTRHHKREQ